MLLLTLLCLCCACAARILMLDDDITIAMDIRMQLHALGHTMAGHATRGLPE